MLTLQRYKELKSEQKKVMRGVSADTEIKLAYYKIDSYLKEAIDGDGYAFLVPPTLTLATAQRIAQDYANNGWIAKVFHYDGGKITISIWPAEPAAHITGVVYNITAQIKDEEQNEF